MRAASIWILFAFLIFLLSACYAEMVDPTEVEATDQGTSMESSAGATESTGAIDSAGASGSVEWSHEAALTRFLTDVNHKGSIPPGDKPVPPGTLPEVSRIPKADQSWVGSTVQVILARQQQVIPFYYFCGDDGTERLAMVVEAERIPLLIVLETALGGYQKLCEKIAAQEVFTGRVLSMTNICPQENHYAYAACSIVENVAAQEIINMESPTGGPGKGVFVGAVGVTAGDKTVSMMMGSFSGDASEALHSKLKVFQRMFERYELTDFTVF